MPVLVLFDIDGTILRMKRGHSKIIFSKMLNEIFGISAETADMPDFSGRTDLDILNEIAVKNNISKKDIYNRIDEIWDRIYVFFGQYCSKEYIDLMPGADSLIKLLNESGDYQLGILSGNFKDNAYQKLSVFELQDYFPFGAFGSDEADRNLLPPIAIERANNYFNKDTFYFDNTVIIGDSERDIECAKKNNIVSVAVTTGFTSYDELNQCEPDYLLNDLSQNERVIEILLNLL